MHAHQRTRRQLLGALGALCGWLLAVGPASAQKNAPARKVEDQAGMFSPAAVRRGRTI